jgi:iron complex transport system substrate-binding protein
MRKTTPAIWLLTLAVALAGCGGGRPAPASTPSPGAAYPVTVAGVTLDQRPTHIISLSPTTTEMLFAIGAGSQVSAVDDQSNYPPQAPKTNLSGYKPNTEAIAAKNPDLVVISDNTTKIKESLAQLKIPVYEADPATTLDDSYRQLRDLGTLTGHAGEAGTAVQRIKDGIGAVVKGAQPRAKPLTYYYELDSTLYSVTSKTFIGSLFSRLGLVNIADPADKTGGGYPQLSAETIVKANPDLIFLADTKCCQQSPATVAKRPGWAGLSAVQQGDVVPLDDDIASRWGPRVVELVQAIAAAVAKVPAS